MSDRAQTDARQRLGRWGERVAATYLESIGNEVIARNWRCRHGEIDLVLRDRDTIVFVEVKTRRGRDFGAPEEALTPRKAQKLLELGQQYIADHELADSAWRIDLVAVELDQDGHLIRCDHIPNAVLGW